MEYYNTEMRCVLKVLFWMAINFFEIKTKEKKMKILHKIKVKNMIDEILRYNSKCSQWYRFVQAEEKIQRRDPKPFLCQFLKVRKFSQLFFKKILNCDGLWQW